MNHIKKFENIENIEFMPDREFIPNTGDIIYCINNKGQEKELILGGKYTVGQIWPDRKQFKIIETESRWISWRFTQNPHHPTVLKQNMNKYNI